LDYLDTSEYWEDRLGKNFNIRDVGFQALGFNYNQWAYKVRKNVFQKQIKLLNLDYNQLEILDIGCGTGFYVENWEKFGVKSITGYDITSTAVMSLKKKYPKYRFYQVDIGQSLNNTIRQSYDIITAFDVLFHIVDDSQYTKAFQNIYSLLRPGGYFIFSEFFLHGETFRDSHVVGRPLDKIKNILNKSGFKIIKRVPMLVFMNYPIDSKYRFFKLSWNLITFPAQKSEIYGFILGSILYPFELLTLSIVKESFSTEIMICKKVK
jgi:SAM-dependent methyltransferase